MLLTVVDPNAARADLIDVKDSRVTLGSSRVHVLQKDSRSAMSCLTLAFTNDRHLELDFIASMEFKVKISPDFLVDDGVVVLRDLSRFHVIVDTAVAVVSGDNDHSPPWCQQSIDNKPPSVIFFQNGTGNFI